MIAGLIILFLFWAIFCFYKREYAIAALIVLVPTYQLRFSILGLPTTVLEWLIGILVVVFVVDVIRKKQRVVLPYWWLVYLFVLSGIIATATSVDVRAGLGLFKAYIIEPVLVYLVVVNTMKTPASQKLLRYAFFALVVIVALVAILQAAHLVYVPEPYASQHPRRVTSLYPFPTAIGKLVAPLIGFFIAYCYFAFFSLKRNSKTALLFALPVALGFLSLVFSVNRGAMIGVALATAFVILAARHWKAFVAIALILIIAALAVPQVNRYVAKVFDRQDTSTDVRVVMWKGTLRLLEAHPIFGAGLGGFPTLYNVYRDASHVELFPNPDQLILTLWTEMGMFGMFVFFVVLGVWIRECVLLMKNAEWKSEQWVIGAAGIAAIIAFFAHGMLDTPYFKNDLAVIFWMLFAVIILARRNSVTTTSVV